MLSSSEYESLEDDLTKKSISVRYLMLTLECFRGKHVVNHNPFSEFDGESSTKDAFSDILKSMVQKVFLTYPRCSSLC